MNQTTVYDFAALKQAPKSKCKCLLAPTVEGEEQIARLTRRLHRQRKQLLEMAVEIGLQQLARAELRIAPAAPAPYPVARDSRFSGWN